jgi:hypothetical protein
MSQKISHLRRREFRKRGGLRDAKLLHLRRVRHQLASQEGLCSMEYVCMYVCM